MANINISDLRPAGADLFSDSESFMMDLSDDDITTSGGISPTVYVAIGVGVGTVALGFGAAALLDKYF